MKLTIEKVKLWSPCPESLVWADPIWNGREEDSLVVLNRLIAEKKYEWANWLIVRCMTRPQYLAYAIYSAERAIKIYEKKYPEENRPRKAIEAAKKVLRGDSKENRSEAAARAAEAWNATRNETWKRILGYGMSLLANEN